MKKNNENELITGLYIDLESIFDFRHVLLDRLGIPVGDWYKTRLQDHAQDCMSNRVFKRIYDTNIKILLDRDKLHFTAMRELVYDYISTASSDLKFRGFDSLVEVYIDASKFNLTESYRGYLEITIGDFIFPKQNVKIHILDKSLSISSIRKNIALIIRYDALGFIDRFIRFGLNGDNTIPDVMLIAPMLHRNTTAVYTADTLKKELSVIEINYGPLVMLKFQKVKYWNKI